MIITKSWAMPSKNTFSIKPISVLIDKYIKGNKVWLDPFCNNSIFASQCKFTNDLNKDFQTTHHLESLEFLKLFDDNSVDGVLFDPPYSVRQISEIYKGIGKECTQDDTKSSWYTFRKKEIARIVKPNGLVISFGWNSGGIGKKLMFEQIEILLVAHGGCHNDTIVVCERKLSNDRS